jgi:hypothetical protein
MFDMIDLTQLDTPETTVLAMCLGLITLFVFRMCSSHPSVLRWALLDLLFVTAMATIFQRPQTSASDLFWYAAVGSTVLGSIGLLSPVHERRTPVPEEPETTIRKEPSIERLKKAA